jgi:hypothetical protein|nr:MAG TPA: hypothetical protein [Caudoviricetes sp.]DAV35996.1 MAG TPA: hypothetical protein [Caudoviricetes sp.]
MEKVTLLRHRGTEYVVNYENKKYVWPPSKGNIISKRDVPMDVYEWLTSYTTAFRFGELVLDKTNENIDELKEHIYEIEDYEANSISKDEIKKILEGNFKKMESELNKIKLDSTKRFVLDVAKEIKIESAAKQRFIKEWLGTELTIEELFPVEQ